MKRFRTTLWLCTLAVGLLIPASASAYVVNVDASISSTYNYDCTATYEGLHYVQFLDVTEADEGQTVGLEGKLYKLGSLSFSIVSQCSTGGVLPQKKIYFCETQWTHTCINRSGPYFEAKSFSMGASDTSDQHRIVCLECDIC